MTTLGPYESGARLEPAAVEGRFRPPVYWSAIAGGVAAALITHFLLNLLGVGVGAAIVDPDVGMGPAAGEAAQQGGTAAYLWWAVSGIISSFVGGWIAGYLTAQAGRGNEMLHGFFAWGLTTLVILLVMAGALGAASRSVGNIAGPVASQADQLGQLSRAGSGQVDVRTDESGARIFTFTQPNGERVEVTEQQMVQRAEQAADALAQGALWSFAALVLGAAAAIFGASAGRRARLPDGRIPIGAESAPTNAKVDQRAQPQR